MAAGHGGGGIEPAVGAWGCPDPTCTDTAQVWASSSRPAPACGSPSLGRTSRRRLRESDIVLVPSTPVGCDGRPGGWRMAGSNWAARATAKHISAECRTAAELGA